jgi:hypothetical protein
VLSVNTPVVLSVNTPVVLSVNTPVVLSVNTPVIVFPQELWVYLKPAQALNKPTIPEEKLREKNLTNCLLD